MQRQVNLQVRKVADKSLKFDRYNLKISINGVVESSVLHPTVGSMLDSLDNILNQMYLPIDLEELVLTIFYDKDFCSTINISNNRADLNLYNIFNLKGIDYWNLFFNVEYVGE